jgi:hypothetical protein
MGYLLWFSRFLIDFGLLIEHFVHYWWILGPFLGQILGGSWGMISKSIYIYIYIYKPGLLEAMKEGLRAELC